MNLLHLVRGRVFLGAGFGQDGSLASLLALAGHRRCFHGHVLLSLADYGCLFDSCACSLLVKAGSLRVLGGVLDHLLHDRVVAKGLSVDACRREDGIVVTDDARVLGL